MRSFAEHLFEQIMQSAKLWKYFRFVPNQLLAVKKKTAGQLWEIQISQASELDFREIMQATWQII